MIISMTELWQTVFHIYHHKAAPKPRQMMERRQKQCRFMWLLAAQQHG